MTHTPRISILVPTFNRATLIPFAIKSILCQTETNVELLILDDASTDNTREVIGEFLKDPRVRYIVHPKNIGITANRNYGLSIAQGEYIAMLDSDDVWSDECKLKRQLEFMDMHSEYGLVGTFAQKIDDKGEIIISDKLRHKIGNIFRGAADSTIRRFFMLKNQFAQSSVLIRKKALDEVGWYDEKLLIWEDYELWLRIGEKYKLRNIPEALTQLRIHSGSISADKKSTYLDTELHIISLHKKAYPHYWIGFLKLWIKRLI